MWRAVTIIQCVKKPMQRYKVTIAPAMLPASVLCNIFGTLGIKQYYYLSLTCKKWREALQVNCMALLPVQARKVATQSGVYRNIRARRVQEPKQFFDAQNCMDIKKEDNLWPYLTSFDAAVESVERYQLALQSSSFLTSVDSLSRAVGRTGNMDIVLMHTRNPTTQVVRAILEGATSRGHVNMMKWFAKEYTVRIMNDYELAEIAVYSNQIEALQYLLDLKPSRINARLLGGFYKVQFANIMVAEKYITMLQHFLPVFNMTSVQHYYWGIAVPAFRSAVQGKVEIVKILVTHSLKAALYACVGAVWSKQDELFDWLMTEFGSMMDCNTIKEYVEQYVVEFGEDWNLRRIESRVESTELSTINIKVQEYDMWMLVHSCISPKLQS